MDEIVTPEMLAFAQVFNRALGKMKDAAETNTNCLLRPDEVGALLEYIRSVIEVMTIMRKESSLDR